MYTMVYLSAVERKEILTYPSIWINFEDISESANHERTDIVQFYLYEITRVVKFI